MAVPISVAQPNPDSTTAPYGTAVRTSNKDSFLGGKYPGIADGRNSNLSRPAFPWKDILAILHNNKDGVIAMGSVSAEECSLYAADEECWLGDRV